MKTSTKLDVMIVVALLGVGAILAVVGGYFQKVVLALVLGCAFGYVVILAIKCPECGTPARTANVDGNVQFSLFSTRCAKCGCEFSKK